MLLNFYCYDSKYCDYHSIIELRITMSFFSLWIWLFASYKCAVKFGMLLPFTERNDCHGW